MNATKRIVAGLASIACLAAAALAWVSPAAATDTATPAPVRIEKVEVGGDLTGKTTVRIDGKVVAPKTGPTASAVQTTTFTPRYNGWAFQFRQVCIWNIMNSSAYNVGWTAGQWQAGTATIIPTVRAASSNCNDFPGWQRLRVYQYSATDGLCVKVTGRRIPVPWPGPVNPYYSTVWDGQDGGPAIWINQAYLSCRNDVEARAHWLSIAEGYAFGLSTFDSDCSIDAVMSTCEIMITLIAGARAYDRNRLYLLMNPS